MMKAFADYESMMDHRYLPGIEKSVEKARETLNWIRGKTATVTSPDNKKHIKWAGQTGSKVRRLGDD